MTTVTLLEKVYDSYSPEALESMLRPLVQDLDVDVKIKERTIQEWIQVEISGEDEAVALRLLDRVFGLAPTSIDKIGKFSLLHGRIISSSRSSDELRLDVGVFTPKTVFATIQLDRLQSQLADGKNLSLQSLIELYCLHDNMPLQIKIVDAESARKKEALEAELSEQQLRLFTGWLKVLLDRLVIVGARRQDVDRAVEGSRHFRDVVKIDRLGLLEHAVVCKLGTDAVGLIPAIGRYLRNAAFSPFSPRRILPSIGMSLFKSETDS